MNMQVVKRIIGVFFLWLVLFTGCTATMDLESMGMEPKLVITGVLSTDRGSQIVEILATVPYFGKELPENIQAKEVLLNGEPLTWTLRAYTLQKYICGRGGQDV